MHEPCRPHMEATLRISKHVQGLLFFLFVRWLDLESILWFGLGGMPYNTKVNYRVLDFFWALRWFLRDERDKRQCICHQQRPNIEPWLELVMKLTWLRYLWRDLGLLHPKPALLRCDNKTALHIAANPIFMNELDIGWHIATLFEIRYTWWFSCHKICSRFTQTCRWYSQKHWEIKLSQILYTSWQFSTSTL